ncbi:MAG: hypothetical protein HYX95_00900, partial [Chloroflexi bacterium]|nr:hypothetical protein [Chloroflexota bacterium]
WVFIKGKLQDRVPLGKLLDMMGPGDIYIKGVNAVDPNNNVGVLTGDQVEEGGTFGSVVAKGRSQGFTIIFPVGLEKLIPVPIREAAREAGFKNALDYSMGMPCTLVPCPGIVVTEPRAIELLTGATATPISAGGLIGAEGALTMVIKGDDDQVTRAIAYVEGVKGTQLPRAALMRDCVVCEKQGCSLRGGGKHWC